MRKMKKNKLSNKKQDRLNFLQKYSDLFWYMDKEKLDTISDEVMVEIILNYGSWQAFLDLISLVGLKKVEKIFKKISRKKRSNLFPKVKHFFTLYFKHNVLSSSK